jgi:hypothetical protein
VVLLVDELDCVQAANAGLCRPGEVYEIQKEEETSYEAMR